MQFCPNDKVMLSHKEGKFVCSKCGYSISGGKIIGKEKMAGRKEVGIVNKGSGENMPIMEQKCPKCGNKRAYFWSVQTRASDEGETSFFKCTDHECGYTWRSYR